MGSVLRYVASAAGADARDALLASLPDDIRLGDVIDGRHWFTADEVNQIADLATALCGSGVGRQVGEDHFRRISTDIVDAIVRAGSVEPAMRLVAAAAATVALRRTFTVIEAGPGHVVLSSTHTDGVPPVAMSCDFASGFFSQVPTLFGMAGTAVETACSRRGSPACLLRVAWTEDPTRRSAGHASPMAQRRRMTEWFEEDQATATRLVAAGDVAELLDEVVRLAGGKVGAPRFLLSVRLSGDDAPRVHHQGFDVEPDVDLLARLRSNRLDDEAGVLVAEVASSHHSYGRLAAFYPEGVVPRDDEVRRLEAYAAHAASALEVIASLEAARRDRDTATALLDLARAFAEVDSAQDVLARLTRSVPGAVGCDVGSVWLLDPEAQRVRLAGCRDRRGREIDLGLDHLDLDQIPDVVDRIWARRAVLLGASEAPDDLRPALTRLGLRQLAVVPIAAGNVLLGVVVAAFRTSPPVDSENTLFERLRGLGDLTATALEKANLMDRMRFQALHDPLTGLPNRSIVEDRGRQALVRTERTGRRVGMLFVDLDNFKSINDTLGHAVGDEVIRLTAARLAGLMRSADTVARVGGDEFVVLVPDVDREADAVEVAQRIIERMREPIVAEGHELSLTCSVGVATADAEEATFEELTRRADAAMYQAKAGGRRTFVVHDPAAAPVADVRDGVDLTR